MPVVQEARVADVLERHRPHLGQLNGQVERGLQGGQAPDGEVGVQELLEDLDRGGQGPAGASNAVPTPPSSARLTFPKSESPGGETEPCATNSPDLVPNQLRGNPR